MEIGEHEVQIFPESIEVRSFGNCEPECPFINSVSFSLSKSGSQNFSIFAQGVPVPVLEKLHDTLSLFITLPSSQAPVLLKFNSRDQLAELRLTLEINGNVNSAGEKHQASWYTHAELFAMALGKLPVNAKNSDETTQAQNAVLEGRELELEQLLQSGVNTNIRYADGQTMLMHASNRGDLKMIKLLLANGADVNAKTPINKDGLGAITALHKALLVDAVNIVDELIKAGANPLAEANGVWTPLHYAAYRGATQSIRYLHQHKLNIDEPFHGARGSTPLMIAAEHAQVPTIQLLLELGADPKRKDSYGEDACGYAKFFKKPASMSALSCE
jgi:ankyrin repeat protein